MPTFKAVVLKQHVKSDKTVRIKIRVTHKRKIKYLDTGITASLSELTKKLKIKNDAFIKSTNEKIDGYRKKCNSNPDQVERMDIGQLITFLTTEAPTLDPDFIAFGLARVKELRAEGRVRTAEDYTTALNALTRFYGLNNLPVSYLTIIFLTDFQKWVSVTPHTGTKVKPSMVRAPSKYLSCIRAIHNAMKLTYNDEEAGIIRIPFSPFNRFKIKAPPPTRKRAIEPDQIRKIIALPDQPITNGKGGNRYDLAKDCFILSFCLLGMNSADLFDCSTINKTFLTYKRKKTRTRRQDEAVISVKLQPEIRRLLEKYKDKTGEKVFDFHNHYANEHNFNKAINKGLKTIGELIGENDLEFYSARHSWATIARNEVKIEKYTVHAALNHVEQSMKVTDIYLDEDWSLINDANRKVLDFVFKPSSGKA